MSTPTGDSQNPKPKRIPKQWKKNDVKRTYTCEICSWSDNVTKTELNAHYKTHGRALGLKKYCRGPSNPELIFVCEICSTKFTTEEDLHDHVMGHDDQYECDVCQKRFKKILDYTMHLRSHSDDGLYRCPVCDYRTANAYHAKNHVLVKHTMFKRFECPVKDCKKNFAFFTQFQEHKYYHTGEKPFVCEICGSSFMYTRYLNLHKKVYHGDKATEKITCEICSTVCVGELKFYRHQKLHTQPECICATCGRTFRKRAGLKLHEKVHAGYKPHKCRHCDKAFTQKGSLVQHERTHTGDRPYDCDHCDKKFTQRSSLVRHVRGHTGEKPHACHFCNRSYTTKATLNTHLKNCKGPSD